MSLSIEKLDSLFEALASCPQHHGRSSPLYRLLEQTCLHAMQESKPKFTSGAPVSVGELGPLLLPYEKMGAIDSIDLFGLDELLMFAFYRRNRERYRTAADIGANLGLHSIVMSKCGYKVEAYEPDPAHHASLMRNLDLNDVRSCQVFESAVSDRKGSTEFVRVLGNTTSSHLAGAKPNPYGELERFTVSLCDVREIADRVDLMKIDAEGHEAVLLNAIADDQWQRVDAFVEVGSAQNAEAVFNRFRGTPINVFAQSGGWSRVNTLDDMPTSYKQGGIFVTAKSAMPW